MAGLPGVKVGPLDPDTTRDFGQVAAKNSARTLIRLHRQLHPPELVRALARPLDHERTKALVLEEVRGYVSGLKLENGDPVLPEGATVVGAQVRGEGDTEQTLTFTYRTAKSGRTGKWFAPYDVEELPDSAEEGDKLVQASQLRERGLVAWDSEGASTEILRRQLAGLRRENEALRRLAEGKDDGDAEDVEHVETSAEPDLTLTDRAEQLGVENEALKAELAQYRGEAEDEAQRGLREQAQEHADRRAEAEAELQREKEQELADAGGDGVPAAAQDPPSEDYDDLNARDIVDRIKSEDTSDEERRRILDYERSHADRRSVVSAAEQSLGPR